VLLRRLLAEGRPGDAVLGEEGGEAAGHSGLRWIIDPLDGTTNYLHGYPMWAVSIAVEDAAGTALGIVHDPCRAETFTAIRGAGATLNGETIRASQAADPAHAVIATGFSYSPGARAVQAPAVGRLLVAVQDIRRAGSAALDLAWVACGRLDGFYEVPLKPWDLAAGELLVREAGGGVSALGPLEPDGDGGVIAAAPGLHERLREMVGAALDARPAV
jgi:myo-inositol-1(or 4)-monophosphatase